jgi:hypothetical protein
MLENSWVGERLVVSQEGLCSMKLDRGEQFASRLFLEGRRSGSCCAHETQESSQDVIRKREIPPLVGNRIVIFQPVHRLCYSATYMLSTVWILIISKNCYIFLPCLLPSVFKIIPKIDLWTDSTIKIKNQLHPKLYTNFAFDFSFCVRLKESHVFALSLTFDSTGVDKISRRVWYFGLCNRSSPKFRKNLSHLPSGLKVS